MECFIIFLFVSSLWCVIIFSFEMRQKRKLCWVFIQNKKNKNRYSLKMKTIQFRFISRMKILVILINLHIAYSWSFSIIQFFGWIRYHMEKCKFFKQFHCDWNEFKMWYRLYEFYPKVFLINSKENKFIYNVLYEPITFRPGERYDLKIHHFSNTNFMDKRWDTMRNKSKNRIRKMVFIFFSGFW